MKKILSTFFVILLLTIAAFADQAAYITKAEAEKAVALLKDKQQIKHFCNPCDDKEIKLETIDSIEAVPTGYQGTWEVKINGEGIDLAYVYFETKKGEWKNVARELKISVEDVPTFLPEEDED